MKRGSGGEGKEERGYNGDIESEGKENRGERRKIVE